MKPNDKFSSITHFLLALATKLDKDDPSNSVFTPFAKVGTGYTVAELTELREKLNKSWRMYFLL